MKIILISTIFLSIVVSCNMSSKEFEEGVIVRNIKDTTIFFKGDSVKVKRVGPPPSSFKNK